MLDSTGRPESGAPSRPTIAAADPAVRLAGRNLIAAIVGPLLPDEPVLSAGHRAIVERDVVEFVWAQIGSMPAFLRVPYEVALQGFNWSALARHGGIYTRLGRQRQRAWLLAWSAGPLRLGRDLVKPVRSCALLQYLDHPMVLARLESEGGRARAG